MNQYDACKILGLTGNITPQEVKQAYKKACSKYHPDRNPAGTEIMKMVNVAYSVLKEYQGQINTAESVINYSSEVSEALNSIITLNLTIEICGSWVWVSGSTKEYKDTLKDAGFKWAPKKKMWYFRPSDVRKSRSFGKFSIDQIREKYGSEKISKGSRRYIQVA